MSYRNTYAPPQIAPIDAELILAQTHLDYDHNFCIPKAVCDLENDKIKIVPWIPSLHAKPFFEALLPNPESFAYLPLGPFPDVLSVVTTMEARARRREDVLLYAVLDKTKPRTHTQTQADGQDNWPMAGTVGFVSTKPHCLSIEIGYVITFPQFRGTHVTTNAIGLLTLFCLTPETPNTSTPEFPYGGLGLRRVQYQAYPTNELSIRAAERIGFVREGVEKWQRFLSSPEQGGKKRPGDGPEVLGGIDCLILALCWDEWDELKIRSVMEWTGKAHV